LRSCFLPPFIEDKTPPPPRWKCGNPAWWAVYQRRKAIVEPVIEVLKEQRGLRQFHRRGMGKVAVELALAATAYNLTSTGSLIQGRISLLTTQAGLVL
jgi:hypothetical protein